MNVYGYTRNGPVNLSDPFGLAVFSLDIDSTNDVNGAQYDDVTNHDFGDWFTVLFQQYEWFTSTITENIFNQMRAAGNIRLDGQEYHGTRQGFVEAIEGEFFSRRIFQRRGGLAAAKVKLQELATLRRNWYDIVSFEAHGGTTEGVPVGVLVLNGSIEPEASSMLALAQIGNNGVGQYIGVACFQIGSHTERLDYEAPFLKTERQEGCPLWVDLVPMKVKRVVE